MHRRSFMAGTAALALMPGWPARAAPDAELWPRWKAHDPSATAAIDHGAWAGILERHVRPGEDGINRVAYDEVTQAGRDRLRRYLDRLQSVTIDAYARPEQFAFWVNLYNALTLDVVLDHWPVATIRDIDISPGLFADGPWDKKLATVQGIELSLNDIEHRILRPIWGDPRVHYAVNCASIGCPNLRREPFTGAKLDRQLDDAARAYAAHPRGATVRGGELVVSSIYVWFQADFGGDDAGVIAHLRTHAPDAKAAELAGHSHIADDRYDWAINAVTPPA